MIPTGGVAAAGPRETLAALTGAMDLEVATVTTAAHGVTDADAPASAGA